MFLDPRVERNAEAIAMFCDVTVERAREAIRDACRAYAKRTRSNPPASRLTAAYRHRRRARHRRNR